MTTCVKSGSPVFQEIGQYNNISRAYFLGITERCIGFEKHVLYSKIRYVIYWIREIINFAIQKHIIQTCDYIPPSDNE